jgi:hypothetical protein
MTSPKYKVREKKNSKKSIVQKNEKCRRLARQFKT